MGEAKSKHDDCSNRDKIVNNRNKGKKRMIDLKILIING